MESENKIAFKRIIASVMMVISSIYLLPAQNAVDCAVQLSAAVQTTPARITINWLSNASSTQYVVYRKLKTATAWGASIATLSGTTNQYVDSLVTPGVSYEYKVARTGSGYTGNGYINAGIEIAATENRGTIILLIDSTFIDTLAAQILRLEEDLEGDGWQVVKRAVSRTATVVAVKVQVLSAYNIDPAHTKALFILGHVPVPYSGNLNPDGHPDHLGAWPTDTYYADINGNWTDASITSTTASPPRTQNIPGDGKFDQSSIPTDLELQTGRVDFANLPSIALSEIQLMKNYLDKDHAYRKKIFSVNKMGLVDDNFGYMSNEAFAASGYNNMSVLVGSTNTTAGDYLTNMSANSYLWSYGCGGGWFSGASGVGSTNDFSGSNLQTVFTMLFGSYFGDWDASDNFLRASLAQGKTLTAVWSGRPHWAFHHMALGENIGYSAIITQNKQSTLYFPNIYGINGRWVHNALLGDPTLRNDVVAPVNNLVASMVGSDAVLTWSPSHDTDVIGYNIYRKNNSNDSYVKINSTIINDTNYVQTCVLDTGTYKYMVRAVKLENTPSGSYYNLSEGIWDTAYNATYNGVVASFNYSLLMDSVVFTNASGNALSYSWSFGDGDSSTLANPTHVYTNNGTYTVSLTIFNTCDTTSISNPLVIAGIGIRNMQTPEWSVFPNPFQDKLRVALPSGETLEEMKLLDSFGRELKHMYHTPQLATDDISAGTYILWVRTKNSAYSTIVIKSN